MALDYGWGSRKGQDCWHVIKIEEEESNPTVGVAICGDGVLSRDSGDYIDYGGHPRIGTRCEKCEESRIEGWLDWLDTDCKDKEPQNVTQNVEPIEALVVIPEMKKLADIQENIETNKVFQFIATRNNKDIDEYFSHPKLSAAEFKYALFDQLAIISFRCNKRGPKTEYVPIGELCTVTFEDDGMVRIQATIRTKKQIAVESENGNRYRNNVALIRTRKMFYFVATRRNKDIDKYFNSHKQLMDVEFKCVLTGDNVAIISFRCPKLGPGEEIVPIGYFCIITFKDDGTVCVGTTPQIPKELVDLIKIGGECGETTFTLRP